MSRYPQELCPKGSQRWIQWFVNEQPAVLEDAIGIGPIDWRSPLREDDYAEYRDQAFLDRLRIRLGRRLLPSFWPRGGPQWDALGRSESGEVILVEAKAHLNELYSPPMGATADSSIARIQLSLRETALALNVRDGNDWSKQFYQYANRLAHGYLLNVLNSIPTKLVFVYFVGDHDMLGPDSRDQWDTAIQTVHDLLGLATAPSWLVEAFLDVRSVATIPTP